MPLFNQIFYNPGAYTAISSGQHIMHDAIDLLLYLPLEQFGFGLTIFKIENDHVHALINEHISDHYSVRMKN